MGKVAPFLLAGLLGAAGPLLASCGSSGAGLIPAQDAGPLRADFDAVASAAEKGNGSCVSTEEAILKTEQDFGSLPATLDGGLRNRLREGISTLRSDALGICKQPVASPTATNTTSRTTTATRTTATTPTVTQTTSTPTQTAPPTTSTPTTGTGGGTPAPTGNEGGAGSEQGANGGGGAGGAPAGGGAGSGGGGQEGAK